MAAGQYLRNLAEVLSSKNSFSKLKGHFRMYHAGEDKTHRAQVKMVAINLKRNPAAKTIQEPFPKRLF